MKICVIGNSHAGALKRALDRIAQPSHTFDFLAQVGGLGPRLEIRNGRVFAASAMARPDQAFLGDHQDGVDLASCDAVLFAAAGLPAHLARIKRDPLNNLLHAGFAKRPVSGRQSVSGAVMAMALEHTLLAMPAMAGIRLIRSVFSGPLVVIARPLPGRGIDATPDPSDLPLQYGAQLDAFMTWYYREQTRVITNETRLIGAACLPPPEDILLAGHMPERYCGIDPWHANADYGEITLDRALKLIGAASIS